MRKIILFTILISSLALAGCVKKTPVAVDDIQNEATGKQIDRQTENDQDEQQEIDEIKGTEDWQVYEKFDMNVRFKYHKDWYYDRDEQAEKKLGYDLYIGFAESPKILNQGNPYPIEFIIVNKNFEWKYKGYLREITIRDNKKYILRTGNKEEYGDILDKMAESFEFLDEIDEVADWQTYRNDEHGFEFKYPEELFITEENKIDDKITILLRDKDYLELLYSPITTVLVKKNKNKLTLNQVITAIKDKYISLVPDIEKEYKIGDIKAYKIVFLDPSGHYDVFIKDDNIYEINSDAEVEKIISTFKFIN